MVIVRGGGARDGGDGSDTELIRPCVRFFIGI